MLIKKLTKQLNFKDEKFPVQKKPTQTYKKNYISTNVFG